MAETSVRQWLSSIGCDQYVTLFEGNGYYHVDSLRWARPLQFIVWGILFQSVCAKVHRASTSLGRYWCDHGVMCALLFCSALDDDKLTVLGVFNANHRRAILNKASSAITSDFDDMLGDLSSVIKDLEAFTVVRTYIRPSL